MLSDVPLFSMTVDLAMPTVLCILDVTCFNEYRKTREVLTSIRKREKFSKQKCCSYAE